MVPEGVVRELFTCSLVRGRVRSGRTTTGIGNKLALEVSKYLVPGKLISGLLMVPHCSSAFQSKSSNSGLMVV